MSGPARSRNPHPFDTGEPERGAERGVQITQNNNQRGVQITQNQCSSKPSPTEPKKPTGQTSKANQ